MCESPGTSASAVVSAVVSECGSEWVCDLCVSVLVRQPVQ